MSRQTVLKLGLLFATGLCTAWWFASRSNKTDAFTTSSGQINVPVDAPDDAKRIAKRVNWGDMQAYFNVTNPRIEQRFDQKIDPTGYWVVAFEVTAKEATRGGLFVAEFQDSAGVRVGRGNLPVMLEPDYVTQPPFLWTKGQRSRGWFLIPSQSASSRNGSPSLGAVQVVVRRIRF